jgi:hypothetical protein
VAVLEQLDLAGEDLLRPLRERHIETVTTFRGEPVGAMRPALRLEIC